MTDGNDTRKKLGAKKREEEEEEEDARPPSINPERIEKSFVSPILDGKYNLTIFDKVSDVHTRPIALETCEINKGLAPNLLPYHNFKYMLRSSQSARRWLYKI